MGIKKGAKKPPESRKAEDVRKILQETEKSDRQKIITEKDKRFFERLGVNIQK